MIEILISRPSYRNEKELATYSIKCDSVKELQDILDTLESKGLISKKAEKR